MWAVNWLNNHTDQKSNLGMKWWKEHHLLRRRGVITTPHLQLCLLGENWKPSLLPTSTESSLFSVIFHITSSFYITSNTSKYDITTDNTRFWRTNSDQAITSARVQMEIWHVRRNGNFHVNLAFCAKGCNVKYRMDVKITILCKWKQMMFILKITRVVIKTSCMMEPDWV